MSLDADWHGHGMLHSQYRPVRHLWHQANPPDHKKNLQLWSLWAPVPRASAVQGGPDHKKKCSFSCAWQPGPSPAMNRTLGPLMLLLSELTASMFLCTVSIFLQSADPLVQSTQRWHLQHMIMRKLAISKSELSRNQSLVLDKKLNSPRLPTEGTSILSLSADK